MCMFLSKLILTSLLIFTFSTTTFSKIWGFVDDNGEVYIANKKIDKRYQLFTKSGNINSIIVPANKTELPIIAPPKINKALMENYRELIKEIADKYQIDAALLHAIIAVESGYTPTAVSNKGAIGLMQVMPATGSRFGISDLTTPKQNITAGAKYLKFLMKLFKKDLPLVLAAYNAGEGAVIQYKFSIPPYAETRSYVAKVLAIYNNKHSLNPNYINATNKKGGRITATIAPDTKPLMNAPNSL